MKRLYYLFLKICYELVSYSITGGVEMVYPGNRFNDSIWVGDANTSVSIIFDHVLDAFTEVRN